MTNIDISFYGFKICEYAREYFEELYRPCVIHKPRISRDGNMWEVLLGDNPMVGVVAYGETPEKAMRAFDKAWRGDK